MMKKNLFSVFCLGFIFSLGSMELDTGTRSINISKDTDKITEVEIIVQDPCPIVDFAASELADYLTFAMGRRPKITNRESGTVFAIYLGDGIETQKAGINPNALPEEGFVIKRNGKRLFIAGKDSKHVNPANIYQVECRRGTISGVYSFLERFADARFYFPGEMGTLVPPGTHLVLPLRIDIADRPDIRFRSFSVNCGRWFEKMEKYKGVTGYNLNLLRLRVQERRLPLCHGLGRLEFHNRFKDKPEFFALKQDGTRYQQKDAHGPHFCFSSPVKEEIYQDVKAYFTGKAPSERGMKSWSSNAFSDRQYANVMPGDWFYACTCKSCLTMQGLKTGGRTPEVWGPERRKLNDFIWQFTVDIANRLKKEKIPGVICQMAYLPYDMVPPFPIPDNVLVIAAAKGPGSNDADIIDKWVKKTNGPVGLWTYSTGKHGSKNINGIPVLMHNRIADYYSRHAPNLLCSHMESETDHYLFNALNYYIYSKIMWNRSENTTVLLNEYFTRMFGGGASRMRQVYDHLEECWVKHVIGAVEDTPLGPVAKIPSTYTIWADIYSPAFIKKLKDLCLEAESAAEDVQTKKRIRFMKQKLLQPLEEESSNYFRGLNSLKDWQFHIPGEIYLRPLKGETAELKTKVSISETPESFIFLFECEEPQMDSMVSMAEKNDDPAIASTDSCIEIMLNPSGDRMHCIHIAVNGNGAIFDRMNVGGTHGDITWNSNAGVDVTRRANSWTARVSLPKKMLGGYDPKGFPVNFARQRIVKDAPPQYYHWSPLPRRNFHEARYYGIMRLDNSKESNLVLNPDFVQENPVSKLPLHWSFWREDENSVVCCDEKVFISGGKSLYMKNTKGKRVTAGMKLNGLKPNTDYLLSFYARTRNLAGRGGAGIHVSFGGLKRYPRNYLPETMPWSRFEYRIRTKKEISEKETIGLWIWFAEGEVWFDRIALKELPQKEGNK